MILNDLVDRLAGCYKPLGAAFLKLSNSVSVVVSTGSHLNLNGTKCSLKYQKTATKTLSTEISIELSAA